MRLKINGEWRELDEVSTAAELLERLGIQPETVGVMVNGLVLTRDGLGASPVADGDEVEIVRFVGGG
jgi:sulfur carrier protein